MNKAKIQEELAQRKLILTQRLEELEEIKKLNPFHYFQPMGNQPTAKGWDLLHEFLEPEDILAMSTDGQDDAFKSNADILFISGGNRSGKSATCRVMELILATGEIPESLKNTFPLERLIKKNTLVRGRVCCVDNKQLNSVVLSLDGGYKYWTPKEYLKAGDWDKSYSKELDQLTLYKKTAQGVQYPCAIIEFKTYTQSLDSFQGPTLHFVSYDEEPPKAIYKENLFRFGTAERLQIFLGETPTKGMTWTVDFTIVDSEYSDDLCKALSVDAFELNPANNTHVNLDVIRKILGFLDSYEEILMRLLGKHVSLSGLIYRNFKPASVLIEPFEIDAEDQKDWMYRVSLDPHQATPTGVLISAIHKDKPNQRIIVDGWMKAYQNVEEIKVHLHKYMTGKNWRMSVVDQSCDATIRMAGNYNIYRKFSTGAFRLKGLRKSIKFTGSIDSGIDEIKTLMKAGDFKVFNKASLRPLIKSFKTLERDRWRNEESKGEKDTIREGRHHLHACVRYLFQYPFKYLDPIESTQLSLPDADFDEFGVYEPLDLSIQ